MVSIDIDALVMLLTKIGPQLQNQDDFMVRAHQFLVVILCLAVD